MNIQRITIGIAWLVSLLAAYYIGSGRSDQPAPSADSPASKTANARDDSAGRQSHAAVRKLDGSESEGSRGEKTDIAALIARARVNMGSGMGGMMNLRGMLRAIAPIAELDDSQLQEAIAEVEKTVREPQQKMMLLSLLLGQWAEKDGKAALDYAEKNLGTNPMFGAGLKSSILGAWAHADPDGAWRWFQTEGKVSGDDRNAMMTVTALFAGLAAQNLESTLIRLDSLDENQRPMALSGIATAARDADGRQRLLDRSSTLPATARDTLRQNALSQWAWSEPDAALAWFHALPAEEQKPLRPSVAQSILMMDPRKGSEVMLEGATDEERPRIYDQVVGQWAMSDARAAGEWLTRQPQGSELDSARMTYASIVARKEPAAAMDWAKSVTNPELRARSIGQTYQAWKTRDAAAADAALEASGLNAETIQSLRTSKAPSTEPTPTGVMRTYSGRVTP